MNTNALIGIVLTVVLTAIFGSIAYDALAGCADAVSSVSSPLFDALN